MTTFADVQPGEVFHFADLDFDTARNEGQLFIKTNGGQAVQVSNGALVNPGRLDPVRVVHATLRVSPL